MYLLRGLVINDLLQKLLSEAYFFFKFANYVVIFEYDAIKYMTQVKEKVYDCVSSCHVNLCMFISLHVYYKNV